MHNYAEAAIDCRGQRMEGVSAPRLVLDIVFARSSDEEGSAGRI